MLKRLKKKWGVNSDFQLFVIFVVFGITGSASVFLEESLLNLFTISPELFSNFPLGNILYFLLRIIITSLLYQVLLIFFGTIFFQFKFFWKFEKKILRRLGVKL
ncbi:MAG: diacylglyceryl transferase [Flavobacteriaceae bacterium]|nr:diacylglyceryl transferase [Flavobacteriaceae bacterium]